MLHDTEDKDSPPDEAGYPGNAATTVVYIHLTGDFGPATLPAQAPASITAFRSSISVRNAFFIEPALSEKIRLMDMHRIHHSVLPEETNRNFSFTLSIRDRAFGTYLAEPKEGQEELVIGLDEYRDPGQLQLPHLLVLPFKKRAEGYSLGSGKDSGRLSS